MVSGVDVGVGLDDVVMSGNVLALVQYARSPLTSLPPSRTWQGNQRYPCSSVDRHSSSRDEA
jgi:hypothetical protein